MSGDGILLSAVFDNVCELKDSRVDQLEYQLHTGTGKKERWPAKASTREVPRRPRLRQARLCKLHLQGLLFFGASKSLVAKANHRQRHSSSSGFSICCCTTSRPFVVIDEATVITSSELLNEKGTAGRCVAMPALQGSPSACKRPRIRQCLSSPHQLQTVLVEETGERITLFFWEPAWTATTHSSSNT